MGLNMGMNTESIHILDAKVAHKRLFPVENGFAYDLFYLAFPADQAQRLADGFRFGVNKPGVMSWQDKDHGHRDGSAPEQWVRGILATEGLSGIVNGGIFLVTLPRVLGYVFNPVSFWLCHDSQNALRAVVCEVNNTFGETHTYLCARSDVGVITPDDVLTGHKMFHVSPFMQRDGEYRFRFALSDRKFGAWIDYYTEEGKKLTTSLTGNLLPYTSANRRRMFWAYPLATLRVVALIHWQAVKLLWKKVRYVPKPVQWPQRVSTIRDNITKI